MDRILNRRHCSLPDDCSFLRLMLDSEQGEPTKLDPTLKQGNFCGVVASTNVT